MNNSNNPVYQTTRETIGPALLKILASLTRQPSLDPKFFDFGEENFYKIFLSREKLGRLSGNDIDLFREILQFVENLDLPTVKLQKFIEENKVSFLNLLQYTSEALTLTMLEKIQLDQISYHPEIIQTLFGKQENECVKFVLQNYPKIDFNQIYFYEVHSLDEQSNGNQVAISHKPIIEALTIKSLSEFKNLFLQYGDTIDFFKPTHTRVYSKKSLAPFLGEDKIVSQLNNEELKSLLAQDIKPLFEQYTTVVNRVIQRLSNRYQAYVDARKRSRDDQKDMKTIQKDCFEFFKVLENSRTNYIDENPETKIAFNQLLITMATHFKAANKKILSNKRAMATVDLKVFNAKKINLSTALIQALDYDLLERIMSKKNIGFNDLTYKNNYHLASSLMTTFLSDDIKKINKSQVKERQEIVKKLIASTNWESVDKYGSNIAVQFLLQKSSTTTPIEYNSTNNNIDVKSTEGEHYRSQHTHYPQHMSLFAGNNVSFSKPNSFGITAQDLLFDYSIQNGVSNVFEDFLKGNKAYGIEGFENYTLDNKVKMFDLLAARFSKIIPELGSYNLSRVTIQIFDRFKIMGFPENPELTDLVMKRFIEQPKFTALMRSIQQKTSNVGPLNDLIISFDKYELNREMLKLSADTTPKPTKKFKL